MRLAIDERTQCAHVWIRRLIVLVAVSALVAVPVEAQQLDRQRPVQLTADHLEYFADGELFVAEGHVRVSNGERSIEADWIGVARGSQRGVASGNVVYRDGRDELRSAFLEFDVESLQGLVYRGELDTGDGGYAIDAEQLIRTGDDEYSVRRGIFTTCHCPEGEKNPWQIDTGRADVEIGGYATAQNTTLDILDVPVLWLPWVIFPVKTERESGVLFPEFGFRGNAGLSVGLPLFWAARKNVGVIATPVYMTKRGFKQNLEVEYLNGRKSKGKVFGAWGRDQERADSSRRDLGGDENRVSRWTVLAEHDQHLPGKVRAKYDIHLISDNAYADDFVELTDFRNDAFLESKLFVSGDVGKDGRLGVVGTSVFVNDLQAADSNDRDSIVHHVAPGVHAEWLSGRESLLSGVVTRFEFDYTHFYNDRLPQDRFGDEPNLVGNDLFADIGVDALPAADSSHPAGEEDGIFSEGEPLADRGHRFVLHPRISLPMRWFDRIEAVPEVGYRQLLYHTRAQNSAAASHLTARFDLRTRLVGAPLGGQLQHIVEPILGWSMVGQASSAGDPLFVPAAATAQRRLRQFERDNVLLDPSDRVNDRQTLTFGVGNRLYLKNRLAGEFNVSIDYNWVGDGTRYSVTRRDKDFSRLVVAGHSSSFWRTSSEFNLTWDPDDRDFEEGLFALTVTPWSWISLRAAYRYRAPRPAETFRFARQLGSDPWDTKTDALSQIEPSATLRIGPYLRLRYRANYDFEFDELLRQQGSVEYSSRCDCWAIGIDVQEQQSGEIRYLVRYSLFGNGNRGLSSTGIAPGDAVSGL
ncbi:MAG: LPS assembly protein LptD [Myxococcota bacterium]|jgi:LPS-assembly protein|nr:LPS assembly protein LptD [Myxococcota bacterium]